ncbi:DUF397 domain-containing protein [Herbihabitans rhizosphaerae]|uniref:DUF397 domain-containing protein n=1 Tax=Herbihabitans rhizosphaerae TaxID=1872711 RepID=UPI00102D14AD|nr:DUF397 domain-containing protein [Herbihabitans rhizosphaerae]
MSTVDGLVQARLTPRDGEGDWDLAGSFSGGTCESECVELAVVPGTIAVRDSKNSGGPIWRSPIGTSSAFSPGCAAKQRSFTAGRKIGSGPL